MKTNLPHFLSFAGVVVTAIAAAWATARASLQTKRAAEGKNEVDQNWRFRERNDILESMNAELNKRVYLLESEQYVDRGFITRIMDWAKRGKRTGYPTPPRWYYDENNIPHPPRKKEKQS